MEAVNLTNEKDGTCIRIALMQASGKLFLQAAGDREDKPLSRGVFTRMLKALAPTVTWQGVPKNPLHAIAFLSS